MGNVHDIVHKNQYQINNPWPIEFIGFITKPITNNDLKPDHLVNEGAIPMCVSNIILQCAPS